MSLFVMADLHLCKGNPEKTMSVFNGWSDYQERIEKNWLELIKDEDTIVIPGDISWGMSLEEAAPDFRFIENLPGQKIIIKGNHDYWWTTMKKMEGFLSAEGCSSIRILHNNHYKYGNYGICGTRGWVNMPGETQDEKILKREVQRLEMSVKSAVDAGLIPIVFLHYPPIFATNFNYDILEILYRYKIKDCYYGHIHGRSAHELCVKNTYDDVNFHLISGDYLQFVPEKIF
ncbi:MAG: metallophosphoesterase [Ruminococcus sp.]|uniref:metallophosphoesterase n=1 Tax=Ruminococcus sp. TaxID=41978 RepID=UPI001B129C54|nr:metallophosphoesterase [Ruminococcus sp.]MBO7473953.1 metallophosphoesterase [Ruminococcus sp.]